MRTAFHRATLSAIFPGRYRGISYHIGGQDDGYLTRGHDLRPPRELSPILHLTLRFYFYDLIVLSALMALNTYFKSRYQFKILPCCNKLSTGLFSTQVKHPVSKQFHHPTPTSLSTHFSLLNQDILRRC